MYVVTKQKRLSNRWAEEALQSGLVRKSRCDAGSPPLQFAVPYHHQ
jgi:hypothetical protein